MNELALYTLLIFVFLFCGLTVENDESKLLGYILIAILLAVVVYNSVVILIFTVRFAKIFIRKLIIKLRGAQPSAIKKRRHRKNMKVHPLPLGIEESKYEVQIELWDKRKGKDTYEAIRPNMMLRNDANDMKSDRSN